MWALWSGALLAWAGLAEAARVVVLCHNPVLIRVDGRVVESPETGISVVADQLPPGRHLVEATTALGRPLASVEVQLSGDGAIFLDYAERAFTVVDPRVARPGGQGGQGGQGAVAVVPAPGGGVVVIPVPVGGGSGAPTAPVAPVAPVAPTPPRTDPVSVDFLSTDNEWANVYVDGELVLELRTEPRGTLRLTPGLHYVEIRDFMDREVRAAGTLRVGAVDPLKIGFTKAGQIQVYTDPKAWQPR